MALCALSVGEMFSLGGITTLLGLGMIFIVLTLLIGCVIVMDFILKRLTKFLEQRKAAKKLTPVGATGTSSENVEVESNISQQLSQSNTPEEQIHAETMAAIRSAVQIYVTENNDDGKLHENVTIKSVTRV